MFIQWLHEVFKDPSVSVFLATYSEVTLVHRVAPQGTEWLLHHQASHPGQDDIHQKGEDVLSLLHSSL